MSLGHAIGIPFRRGGGVNWEAYWDSLISVTVEDAAPTHVVLTFPTAKDLTDTDFTIAGFTINSASWAGAVLTLVLAETVVYGDTLVVTFVETGGTASVTNNVSPEAELTTYITGLTTPLSQAERRRVNILIKSIKTALSATNLTDVADFCHILAGETAEQQLKNLIKNAHHCTGLTPLISLAGKGRKGDGASLYLDTNYNPATQAQRYARDSASLGIYSRLENKQAGVDAGCRKVGVAYVMIQPWTATDVFVARINADAAGNLTGAYETTKSLLLVNRTASDATQYFKNKVKTSLTTASTGVPSVNFLLGAWMVTATPVNFSNRLFAFSWCGRGLSDAEESALQDAFDAYLIDNGNGVEESLYGILSDTGHCWFTRQKALYNVATNKTWIIQTHDSGAGYTQHIIILNNTTNAVTAIQVGTVISKDDHNEGSVLVRASDSKLFICYAEHQTSTNLRYRISTNALDASAWGAESIYSTVTNVTYPSCFQAATGDVFIFYRETTACACYIKSSDGGVNFAGRVNFFAGITTRGYVLHAQSPINANIIHFIISTEHPFAGTNVSCYAFYFDCSTEKFYKLDGTETTANIPFDAVGDMTAVMTATNPDVSWIEDIIVDSNGYPRYLMTFYPSGKTTTYLTKDLYYSEWTGAALTAPHKIHTETVRNIGGTETTYPPCSCFDVNDPDVIIASKDVNNVLEIFKITRIASDDFSSEQITENSFYDQWRPVTVKSAVNNVFWLRRKIYASYTDFEEALVMDTI